MIKKVLIADRDEPAVRIIRACRSLGLQSVAVYSSEDTQGLPVKLADQSICIGGGTAENSYLDKERLISAALAVKADAIHPGFGDLSESADFASLCQAYGLLFIGPSPQVLDQLCDQAQIFRRIAEAGLPVISHPIHGEIVLEQPRRIAVQIIADRFGNIVSLGERDCSGQTQQQKLVEEAPSPSLDSAVRQTLNEMAVRAAEAVDCTNATTVEFMMDRSKRFYVSKLTARIEAGHGLTEMVTGADLVMEQIRLAGGKSLSFKQEDLAVKGHAIGCFINTDSTAEPVLIKGLHLPAGSGVRVDTAMYSGCQLSSKYGSAIARLFVHASNRQEGIGKMAAALEEMVVLGAATDLDFHYRLLRHSAFIERTASPELLEQMLRNEEEI